MLIIDLIKSGDFNDVVKHQIALEVSQALSIRLAPASLRVVEVLDTHSPEEIESLVESHLQDTDYPLCAPISDWHAQNSPFLRQVYEILASLLARRGRPPLHLIWWGIWDGPQWILSEERPAGVKFVEVVG